MQKILLGGLALLLIASCSKDPIESPRSQNDGKTLVFKAYTGEMTADEETRAGYDGVKSIWHVGDAIGLTFDASNKNLEFTQQAGSLSADGTQVTFEGTLNTPITGQVSCTAYFPYSATASTSGMSVTTAFPATQTYMAGGFRNIPLFGKYTGDINAVAFRFKNLFSVIRVSLTVTAPLSNGVMLQKIIIQGNNNEVMSGNMTVDMSGATPAVSYSGTGKTVTLDCGTGVALNSATPQLFYIAVPAINYTKGYSFTFVTNQGQLTKSVKGTGANYAPNKIYTTPNLALTSLSVLSIPDGNLRNALADLGLITILDPLNNIVNITSAGLQATSINVSGKNITDLTGLELFPALVSLSAGNNNIASVDLSKLTLLTNLDLSNNQLTSLNLSANPLLLSLNASANGLSSLDLSAQTALTSLDVSANQLTNLDLHNNILLTNLKVFGNNLVTLNISGLKALLSLNLVDGVESIDALTKTLTVPAAATVQNIVSDGVALTNWLYFVCNDNPNVTSISLKNDTGLLGVTAMRNPNLASIDLSGDLTLANVTANSNALTSINLTGDVALLSLNVASNKLPSINLAGQTALTNLDVSTNLLTNLDLHNNILLTNLKVYGNNLATLNINGLKALLSLNMVNGIESINAVTKTLTVPAAATVQSISSDGVALTNWLNFVCNNNPNVTSISLKNNTGLLTVAATGNTNLASLDVSGNLTLTNVTANSNGLTSLNLTGDVALLSLNAASNKLASINLAGQTAMTSVDVSSNLLTNLDLHNNILLTSAKVYGNNLTTLNISGLVALLTLQLNNTGTNSIAGLKLTIPVGATVQNLIANNASAAVNWTAFDCTGNPNIVTISLQNNLLLTSVVAKNNTKLTSLNVKGSTLLTVLGAIQTSGNAPGFTVTGPL